jgi:alpha 1,6-mannosyltransferase
MTSSKLSRKSIAALLAGVTLTLLTGGHYSYQNFPPRAARVDRISSEHFPSKIWQSWKDDSENPTPRTNGFPHQWRVLNPSFRYERLTDANMDAYVRARAHRSLSDLVISDLFVSLTDPILKAEFLRYLILLYDGGV